MIYLYYSKYLYYRILYKYYFDVVMSLMSIIQTYGMVHARVLSIKTIFFFNNNDFNNL